MEEYRLNAWYIGIRSLKNSLSRFKGYSELSFKLALLKMIGNHNAKDSGGSNIHLVFLPKQGKDKHSRTLLIH